MKMKTCAEEIDAEKKKAQLDEEPVRAQELVALDGVLESKICLNLPLRMIIKLKCPILCQAAFISKNL